MTRAYLRYPHLCGELVAFCAADDVWLASVDGGRAWRLTDDSAPVVGPRFSPDGRLVAWISTRDGHAEVMVINAEGGTSDRLTWFGSSTTTVLGWTADSRVLVASGARDGPRRRNVVHAVALDGSVERLAYGPASGVAVHPDGAVALSTPWSRPPAHWKRYRGGTASRLWLDRDGDGTWVRLLPDVAAGLTGPNWIGDRLVFVSDHAASFPDRAGEQANLWLLDAFGSGDLTQVTHHTSAEGYVRDPTSDGSRITYHSRGVVHRLDHLDGSPVALEITLGGSVATRRQRALQPSEQLTEMRPDHGANASVVEWRGNAFYLAHREGPARVVAAGSGVRIRMPRLLGQSGRVILVSDADGADRLEVHDLAAPGQPHVIGAGVLGRVLHLESNPSGDTAMTISHDGTVRIVDVTAGTIRDVGHSEHGEAQSIAFSPDGRYAVWSQPTHSGTHHQLVGLDLHEPNGTAAALTSGRFNDLSPSFSRDGRYLLFLSARTFDPIYDSHGFDLAFTSAVRPYLIPLAAAEPAPFGPSADGWRISADEPASAGTTDESATTPVPTAASPDWDLDGFEERIVAFPVPSASYRDLRGAKDGVVWVHVTAEGGELGTSRAGVAGEPADVIEFFSFPKRKLEVLVDKADGFEVSGDGERIVVRHADTVTVRPVDHPLKPDDADLVTVDMARLRFELDPVAEWRQMFDETVRLMTDHFWRADMDGVDWGAVVEQYRPVLDRVASTDDLVDVLWELVGELNTSHAYVQPATEPGDLSRRLGLLGADLSLVDGGWRIDRILPGESSDPDARSPLRAAGVGARAGDLVVAVAGQPVDQRFGPVAGLIGAADQPVELTLRSGGNDRRVVVVPLASEEALRYQDWVRGRSAYVDERAGGRLGYVHIPDMMGVGWAQLHRDLHRASRREGLIVDVRFNRGGHLSSLVIERLARRPIGWIVGRHLADEPPYPDEAPPGPVVFVANEHSGSDGDIVNAAAQALGIGPVVGVRTWGGVIGIDGRYKLVDGTGVTQPRYAFWLEGKAWGVENHGVDPDIEVEIAPAEVLCEDTRDRQLDRAIEEALSRLEAAPAATPPPLPPPKVRTP